VVAAAGAVGVEVLLLHAVLAEVLRRRGVGLDRPGGGDVVGGDRVAEPREHPGADDVLDRRRVGRHPVEVRGLADVGGLRVPREGVPLRRRQRLPALVAGEDVGVVLGEHRLADGSSIVFCTSRADGQMSRRKTSVPSDAVPSGWVSKSKSIVPASA
jgi:hypothetical protein